MSHRTRTASLALAAALTASAAARAGDLPPATARGGEDLARAAAESWAADARLVYVENDEELGPAGRSARWGYLFHSPTEKTSRAYSVRGGKIVHAGDLGFVFDAPPLPDRWIDSEPALAAAEAKGGAQFRAEHEGEIRAMFLVRGLFHPRDPDAGTWAVVYDSPSAPGLWVLVDAETGKVVKTWRG